MSTVFRGKIAGKAKKAAECRGLPPGGDAEEGVEGEDDLGRELRKVAGAGEKTVAEGQRAAARRDAAEPPGRVATQFTVTNGGAVAEVVQPVENMPSGMPPVTRLTLQGCQKRETPGSPARGSRRGSPRPRQRSRRRRGSRRHPWKEGSPRPDRGLRDPPPGRRPWGGLPPWPGSPRWGAGSPSRRGRGSRRRKRTGYHVKQLL